MTHAARTPRPAAVAALIGNTPLIPLAFEPEVVTLLCDRAERYFSTRLFEDDQPARCAGEKP